MFFCMAKAVADCGLYVLPAEETDVFGAAEFWEVFEAVQKEKDLYCLREIFRQLSGSVQAQITEVLSREGYRNELRYIKSEV